MASSMALGTKADAERRTELAKAINGMQLRMDIETIPVLTRKIRDITAMGLDYFSSLTGNRYPMPEVKVVDSPLVGVHEENPSTLVLGRRAKEVIVLHELGHHLRACNGINNAVYSQNPYPEEMVTQFISAIVFSRSTDYNTVVTDIYSRTPRQLSNFKLDLVAFQEMACALRTITADKMDLGSDATHKTFFRRAIYDLSRYRKVPRYIDGFNRFDYLRYPVGKGMGALMYANFSDIEETIKHMLLLTQSELTMLVLSAATSKGWDTKFFAVASHLKSKLGAGIDRA